MPACFSVLLTPSFRRHLGRLPLDIRPRIMRAVALLDIVAHDVALYRVRHRSEIYRD